MKVCISQPDEIPTVASHCLKNLNQTNPSLNTGPLLCKLQSRRSLSCVIPDTFFMRCGLISPVMELSVGRPSIGVDDLSEGVSGCGKDDESGSCERKRTRPASDLMLWMAQYLMLAASIGSAVLIRGLHRPSPMHYLSQIFVLGLKPWCADPTRPAVEPSTSPCGLFMGVL